MTDYRYMAKRLLKDNRPKELKEMKDARELEGFLDEIQEGYSQRETEAVQRVRKALPTETPYLQAVQAAEMAKRVAVEILIDELRDLLSPEPEEPDPDDPAYRKRWKKLAIGGQVADWDQMSKEQQDRMVELGLAF